MKWICTQYRQPESESQRLVQRTELLLFEPNKGCYRSRFQHGWEWTVGSDAGNETIANLGINWSENTNLFLWMAESADDLKRRDVQIQDRNLVLLMLILRKSDT